MENSSQVISCDLKQVTSASGVFPVPCPPEMPTPPREGSMQALSQDHGAIHTVDG